LLQASADALKLLKNMVCTIYYYVTIIHAVCILVCILLLSWIWKYSFNVYTYKYIVFRRLFINDNLDLFNYIHFILSNLGFVDWNIFKECYSFYTEYLLNNSILEGLLSGLSIGIKSSILIFIFIWVRASFPRKRFDRLFV